MDSIRRFLGTPKHVVILSCVFLACAWLVLDFVLRDPWTILFVVIALGSSFIVRNLTSGLFADIYWPIVSALQVTICVLLFAGPALLISWLGRGRLAPEKTSLIIIAWLAFYFAALAFLFEPPMPGGNG